MVIVKINPDRSGILKTDCKTVEILKKYTLRGCPFEGYNVFDFLLDIISMYSWIFKPGEVSLETFLQILKKHDKKIELYADDILKIIL